MSKKDCQTTVKSGRNDVPDLLTVKRGYHDESECGKSSQKESAAADKYLSVTYSWRCLGKQEQISVCLANNDHSVEDYYSYKLPISSLCYKVVGRSIGYFQSTLWKV